MQLSSPAYWADLCVSCRHGRAQFFRRAVESGFKLAQCCIWVKQAMVIGAARIITGNIEPVLYGWKPTGSHQWYADGKQTAVCKFDRLLQTAVHPTMKPVALIESRYGIPAARAISWSTRSAVLVQGFWDANRMLAFAGPWRSISSTPM